MRELRAIKGAKGYFAASDGAIVSTRSGIAKDLKPDCREFDGRKRYTIRLDNGSYCRKYGATLILLAFVGAPPYGCEACHNDGNCLNDAIENLRWDTKLANAQDAIRHGVLILTYLTHRGK